jgi:hypothetical protein
MPAQRSFFCHNHFMTRGESNILYKPNVLIKKRKQYTAKRAARGSHPSPALDLFVSDSFLAYLDSKGRVRVFSGSLSDEELQSREEIVLEKEKQHISLSDKALIYTYENDFFLQRLNSRGVESVNFFAPALPGKIIAIHQTEGGLYCLWLSEGTVSDVNLSRRTYESDSSWEDLSAYAVDAPVYAKKGRDMLLCYEGVHEPHALVTISRDGPGDFLALDEKCLMRGNSLPGLIAPIADDRYFALKRNPREDVEVVILQKSGAEQMGMLSHSQAEGIFSLGSEDGEVKDMAAFSSRGALLADHALFLFSDQALSARFALDPELDKDYDRVTLTDRGAILWQEGGKSYQEIILS